MSIRIVSARELCPGDKIDLSYPSQADSPYMCGTVTRITEGENGQIYIRRPYIEWDAAIRTSYIGLEDFTVFRESTRKYKVVGE